MHQNSIESPQKRKRNLRLLACEIEQLLKRMIRKKSETGREILYLSYPSQFLLNFYHQALNRGLTSNESAAEALASFGIAFVLFQFMAGPVIEFRNVSLVLVRSRRDLLVVLCCLFAVSLVLFVLALVIGKYSSKAFFNRPYVL